MAVTPGANLPPTDAGPETLSVTDLYFVTYLALSLPVFFLVPADTPGRLGYAAAHAVALVAIVLARRMGLARSKAGGWILDLYPLPLLGLLYSSVAVLNRVIVRQGYLDAHMIAFEAKVFGGQPSETWRVAWPWPLLSEYLHLAYFLYYTYFASLLFTLMALKRRDALRIAVATVSLNYMVNFVLFCLIPVTGPYWQFPRLDPTEYGYFVPRLVHWIVSHGSALGTAFPSSHVSVSVAVWIMAMRYARRLAIVLAFFVPAMAVATVYGGFHYATDMIAGALLGIVGGTLWHSVSVRIAAARARHGRA